MSALGASGVGGALAALLLCVAGTLGAGQQCGSGERCVLLSQCPAALRSRQRDPSWRPTMCGFAAGSAVPNVCCSQQSDQQDQDKAPPTISCSQLARQRPEPPGPPRPGALAKRMCRKHQEDLCALPILRPGAVCPAAGQYVNILEFPHMALLGYGEEKDIEYFCGGSLIAPDFILTAAHCLKLAGRPVRWALLGATNRTDPKPGEAAEATRQLLEVVEAVPHPDYDPRFKYHDVALLRLRRAARVNAEDVRPACLHTDMDRRHEGQEAVATGWGATSFGDDGSETLIKVNLTVRELQYCREELELDGDKLPQGLQDHQLCAGGGSHGRDTCPGDSGGPLQVRADPSNSQTCMYRIVGVVSFGPPCGLGKPAIYTRVSFYVPWIESVVWPSREGCARTFTYSDGERSAEQILVPSPAPGTVARGMCRIYHVDFCPWYSPHGRYVKPDITPDSICHHQHPVLNLRKSSNLLATTVNLRYGKEPYTMQHACAGALVSPRAVLTAAGCAKLGCLPVVAVVLGLPSSCTGDGVFAVEAVRVHPDYRAGQTYSDLAVLTLREAVDLRKHFPLCLHTVTESLQGRRYWTEGWIMDGYWEDVDFGLANKSLVVLPQDECTASLSRGSREDGAVSTALPRGLQASQLCAGGPEDTYAGDRGMPLARTLHRLLHPELGPFRVDVAVGVASSVSLCGRGLPDVFTRVASHIGWVESVVWPTNGTGGT